MNDTVINKEAPVRNTGDNDVTSAISCLSLPSGFGRAINYETGEIITQVLPGRYEVDKFEVLSNKYLLRSAAKNLLSEARFRADDGSYKYRVCRCGHHLVRGGNGVDIYKSLTAKVAHFGGIISCGSVWHCSVCGAKISLRRRTELCLATQRHHERGGVTGLLTVTVPHSISQDCKEVLDCLQRLFQRLNSGKSANQFRANNKILGQIRSLEFTYGFNGWHPHIHSLILCSEPVSWKELSDNYWIRWAAAAKKEFGWDLPRLSVDLRGGESASDYLSKWSIEAELTMSSMKDGRNGSKNPFGLLFAYVEGDLDAGKVWTDFAISVSRAGEKRVSSTRQLVWTRHLKKQFGITEYSDQEVADRQLEPAILLGTLTYQQWQLIRSQDFDARVVVLMLATTGTFSDVQNFVNSLSDKNINTPLPKSIRNVPICAAAH